MKQRDYRFDNIKCLLIFLVAFGHLIDTLPGEKTDLIFRFIYLFHMPAFIFITGRLASFKPRRVLSMIWCYVLMNTAYIAFSNHLTPDSPMSFTYVTPFWISWYLLAVALYLLAIPMTGDLRPGKCIAMLAVIVLLSLAVGKDSTIAYGLSLSRFFVFMPFFFAGYFIKGLPGLSKKLDELIRKWRLLLLPVTAAVLAALCVWVLIHAQAIRGVLYGSYPYEWSDSGPLLRLIAQVTGFGFILLLFLLAPNKKLPVISMVGKNTLSVYIIHGMLVTYLHTKSIFNYSEGKNLLLAAGLAAGMVLVLSLPPVAWVTNEVFAGHLFGRLWNRLHRLPVKQTGRREKP